MWDYHLEKFEQKKFDNNPVSTWVGQIYHPLFVLGIIFTLGEYFISSTKQARDVIFEIKN